MNNQDFFVHMQSFGEIPVEGLQSFLLEVIKHRIETLPPAEGLTFLLGLDASLYELEGRLSVA